MNAVGIDVGATRIRVGLVDESGKILRIIQFNTKGASPFEILKVVRGMGAGRVGVGVAGYRTEKGLKTPNLDFDIEQLLSLLKTYELIVDNDAVLGALALRELFDMPDNFVYLAFGTGIGAGVYIDGRLVKGRYGNAHEVGHIVVDFRGRLACGCGGRGHWEAFCSGSGLPRLYSLIAMEMGVPQKVVDPAYIFEAKEDPVASAVLEECTRANASGLATIIHLYDPEEIVIGGGLALARWDEFIEPSLRMLKEYSTFAPPKVIKSPLAEATLVGAALAVIRGGAP